MSAQDVRDAARQLAIKSCREQGLEPKITDPVVIGKVAAMLRLRRVQTRARPAPGRSG